MSYREKKAALDATRDFALAKPRGEEKVREANAFSEDHIRRLEDTPRRIKELEEELEELHRKNSKFNDAQKARYIRYLLVNRKSEAPRFVETREALPQSSAMAATGEKKEKKKILEDRRPSFISDFMSLPEEEQRNIIEYRNFIDEDIKLNDKLKKLKKQHLDSVMRKTLTKRGEGKIHASQNFINDSIVHKINGGYKINFMKLRK